MKLVKIGKKEYHQIESIFDIADERFIAFKQWLLQSFEQIDKPSFLALHQRIIKAFNTNEVYNIVVELENFKKALQMSELNYDCYDICFALLHIEREELQNDTGTDRQLRKLQDMRAEVDEEKKPCLTRGFVEETVENFMKASPKHFEHYLGMLEAMKSLSKEEILSALRD